MRPMPRSPPAALALPLLLAPALNARQSCLALDERIEVTDASNLSHLSFGSKVALSADGGRAFVAAHNDSDAAPFAGAVYVFRREASGWVQEAKLYAPDAAAGDELGRDLACDAGGRRLIVHASGDDDLGPETGSFHVFRREGTSWAFEAKLLAPDPRVTGDLSMPIALDAEGEVALIGYWVDGVQDEFRGSALVYRRRGQAWSFEAKLVAGDPQPLAQLGGAVALDAAGRLAFVGAPGADARRGAVYVFEHEAGTWRRLAKLTASDGEENDRFSMVAASADGDTLLVGAPGDDDQGSNAGSAYVLRRLGATWLEQAKLRASDGAARFGLGSAVALDARGETALLCAPMNYPFAPEAGAAYVFRLEGGAWVERERLGVGSAEQEFALDAALDAWGERALVGATAKETQLEGVSFTYRCARPLGACPGLACPCGVAGGPDRGCETAAQTGGARLDETSFLPDGQGGGTLELLAQGLAPEGTPAAILLRSATPLAEGTPFARGISCFGGAPTRVGATLALDGWASFSLAHGAGSGSFGYQLWFRDGAPEACAPTPANLSSALEVTWP